MNSVGQQKVVVADLERVLTPVAGVQEIQVAAAVPLAVADLGDANALSVITAEVDSLVSVQPFPEREQGFCRRLILFLQIDLSQSALQPFVADIVGLALADHRPEGAGNHALCREDGGQEGKVLSLDSILEGDAGGGDKNGFCFQSAIGPEVAERRSSHQVGVGLANSRSSVTQGDAIVQHGVQHPVTECHLFGALCHVLGGEKVFEYVIYLVMGISPVLVGIHSIIPLVGSFSSWYSSYSQLDPR